MRRPPGGTETGAGLLFKYLTVWVAAFCLSAGVAAAASVEEGREAYRAGDYQTAWTILASAADGGDPIAKRYLGYMLLKSVAPHASAGDLHDGVALLLDAARAGDNLALVRLEELRRRALAHSPSFADIVAVETARAAQGDPVTAWRLAKRYQTGDGVEPSTEETVRWLTVVAKADQGVFPKKGEAAYRLCEHYASDKDAADPSEARRWCAAAADNGVPAAAVVLRRLAQLTVE